MRGRVAAAFILGFAAGVLCLAVGLWFVGGLNVGQLHAVVRPLPNVPPVNYNDVARDAPNSTTPPSQLPQVIQGPVTPSPAPIPQHLAPSSDADRLAPDSPAMDKPIMPLAGVDAAKLTDTFSEIHSGHQHEALDIPAPKGTPVKAAVEGNIAKLFRSKEGGLTVYQFDNSQTYAYYYAHLDHYAKNLKEGMLLRKGDVVGAVGSTGNASPNAPHLHFAIFKLGPEKQWWKGDAVDPLPFLR